MPKSDNTLKRHPELAKEYGRRGGLNRRGKKNRKTLIKEALGLEKTNLILEKLDQNIFEFIQHKNEKIRLDATKSFAEFYKPKKREHVGDIAAKIIIRFENIKDDNEETVEKTIRKLAKKDAKKDTEKDAGETQNNDKGTEQTEHTGETVDTVDTGKIYSETGSESDEQ